MKGKGKKFNSLICSKMFEYHQNLRSFLAHRGGRRTVTIMGSLSICMVPLLGRSFSVVHAAIVGRMIALILPPPLAGQGAPI